MLIKKKSDYFNGNVEKQIYMADMFKIHKFLFEYPTLIENSPIDKIEITSDEVIFNIVNDGTNVKIYCNDRDAHSLPMSYLNFAEYETEESKMILQLTKPGDVVFDIGANIGWYTNNILLKHKGSTVYSFEPIKDSFNCLIKNLELNNQSTDNAFNFGLSDKNATEKFYFDRECTAASSMANLREGEDTIIVECETKKLDDFISTLTTINNLDFIKCDVEGAELFVYKGAIETIKEYKPIIFSEMLRKWSKKLGYHPNDIIDLFKGIDYECYIINNECIEKIELVTENTLSTNYLFFHKDKHSSIVNKLLTITSVPRNN
jgi:FkbM family methyltransferase